MKKKIFLIALLVSVFSACKTKKETAAAGPPPPPVDCNAMTVSYDEVRAVLAQNCVSCHSYGNTSGGYDLSKKEDIKRSAGNGYLLGTIKHEDGFSPMPFHAPKLDHATIGKIECWIKNGMKD